MKFRSRRLAGLSEEPPAICTRHSVPGDVPGGKHTGYFEISCVTTIRQLLAEAIAAPPESGERLRALRGADAVSTRVTAAVGRARFAETSVSEASPARNSDGHPAACVLSACRRLSTTAGLAAESLPGPGTFAETAYCGGTRSRIPFAMPPGGDAIREGARHLPALPDERFFRDETQHCHREPDSTAAPPGHGPSPRGCASAGGVFADEPLEGDRRGGIGGLHAVRLNRRRVCNEKRDAYQRASARREPDRAD